ncbi:MAG: transglutaminase family protein [Bacteroidota bacterium]
MKDSEVKALINLLDDPDESIFENVNAKLLGAGEDILPLLEARYGLDDNPIMNERLEKLMEDLKNQNFFTDFRSWWHNENEGQLLHGLFYVNSLYYPDTGFYEFKEKMEKLRRKIWLEMKENQTGFEAIKIMNRYIYIVSGFGVQSSKQKDTAGLFPEYIFTNRKVSPFPFVGLYCLIADSLDLPVFPVYLPGLLVMAYKNKEVARAAYGEESSGVLFYINPYDAGSFLGRKALDYVVEQREIPAEPEHFTPVSYRKFIHKYLRYLWDLNVFSPDNKAYDRLEEMLMIVRGED